MYAKGLSTRQISEQIEDIYGFEVSDGLISDITDKLLPEIEDWQHRPLNEVYQVVYIDDIHFSVRDNHVIKKLAAYIILGINQDGIKEVLSIQIGENESSKYWLSVLNELKNIYVLDNTTYQDDQIYISGLTLPSNYYYNITKDEASEILLEHLNHHPELIKKLPSNLPKVMLIHSPIRLTNQEVLKKLKDYDLLLSGHTHNGMVPDILSKLFKTNRGIIAPNKKLFPSIARGKIERYIGNKKITIIITGGITKLSKKSGKILNKLNFVYNISINKIIITKKRGKYYE